MTPASDETVQVDFSLALGAGRLDASLPVPAGTVTLTQLLPTLHTLSHDIIASTTSIINSEGFTVSCRQGCAACCRQMVPLSVFEAESLAQAIRALPPHEQEALGRRFHAALLALHDAGILTRMDLGQWGEANPLDGQHSDMNMDYLALKIPCPFLVDESCSIHPIRPFACREYLVTSPPAFCEDPATLPVVNVPIPLRLSKPLFKLGALLNDDPPGWMPLVFLFAWMQKGGHPGDAIAGPGPELLYEVVRRLNRD
jgi:Fe-S-cluster containining protein